MNIQYFIQISKDALLAATLIVGLVMMSFFIIEPQVGQAVTSGPFTVKATITDEISFLVNAANVTATGSINGITGGTANGSTTVAVRTNSSGGYYMTIAFFDNGTGQAMEGDAFGGSSIHDYPSAGGEPTYTFSTASSAAVFGYTVSADDTGDIDPSFLHDGVSACNDPGGSSNIINCWMEPTVSAFQIIDRGSATLSATSTIHFRVHVPNNPSPSLVADVYTATATLTALNQ